MQNNNTSSESLHIPKYSILNHRVKIYVTNGMGASGKDSFAQFVAEAMKEKFPITTDDREHFQKFSCVDWPKQVCKYAGWDGQSKEEKDRKLISDINLALEAWDNSPLQTTLDKITSYWKACGIKYFFVDIREPYRIEKFRKMCEEYNYQFFTIFVRRPGVKVITSNDGDKATLEKYNYNYYIDNDNDLESLKKKAYDFVNEILLQP